MYFYNLDNTYQTQIYYLILLSSLVDIKQNSDNYHYLYRRIQNLQMNMVILKLFNYNFNAIYYKIQMYSPRQLMLRKRTESSHKSKKQIEILQYNSGIKIIVQESVLSSLDGYKDCITKFLKFEESYHKLRPVDLQIVNEYALVVKNIAEEISEKRELLINMMLHIFFYRNSKFLKQIYAEKNREDDRRELNRIILEHKTQLNSQEIRALLDWFYDYINHYDLFYFQATSEGSLDINYKVTLDVPTYVPPLQDANFIPQNTKVYTEKDSEEEDMYAKKSTSHQQVNSQVQEIQELFHRSNHSQPKKDEFEEYIGSKIMGASNQLFSQLEDRNKVILDSISHKKK
ncbi:hypothetical protein pb186bvf_020580 [Paramecium bursaria]